MKAAEKERVGTLRLLLTDIKNERIRVGRALEEEEFIALVRRGIKQRQEAAASYRQGRRPELADKEEREADHLAAYLPPPVDEAEIRAAVESYVRAEGLSGPAAIGPVMKAMLAHFAGRADGATLNRIAREVLAS